MCPEHNKEQKIDDTEVCGCPLQSESFYNLPLDEIKFCQNSKKNCRKHYCWEKMYRAEIDIKRIRTLIKLDENLEERRKVKIYIHTRLQIISFLKFFQVEFAISNRFGCALLMMNETIQHSEIRDLRPASRIAQTLEIAKRLKADLKLPEGNTQPTIVKSEEIKTEIEVV